MYVAMCIEKLIHWKAKRYSEGKKKTLFELSQVCRLSPHFWPCKRLSRPLPASTRCNIRPSLKLHIEQEQHFQAHCQAQAEDGQVLCILVQPAGTREAALAANAARPHVLLSKMGPLENPDVFIECFKCAVENTGLARLTVNSLHAVVTVRESPVHSPTASIRKPAVVPGPNFATGLTHTHTNEQSQRDVSKHYFKQHIIIHWWGI